MASTESEETGIVDVKIIQIKNFSRENLYKDERAHFVIEGKNRRSEIFSVLVYRNGLDSTCREYVSVQIFKVHKESDPDAADLKDTLSWTLSVVGVDDVGKYYQSFVESNTPNEFYFVRVPRFIERSVILEQSDELLPCDVLTLRIELSGMSYTTLSPSGNIMFQMPFLKDSEDQKENEEEQLVVCHSRLVSATRVESDLALLFVNLINMLVFMFRFRKDFQGNEVGVEGAKHFLPLIDPMDEIKSLYLGSNPLFQTYLSLNTKFRNSLSRMCHLGEEILEEENIYLEKLEVLSNIMECIYSMPDVRFVFSEPEGGCLPWLSWTVDVEKVGSENSPGAKECVPEKEITAERKAIKKKDDDFSHTNISAGERSPNENHCPLEYVNKLPPESEVHGPEKEVKDSQNSAKAKFVTVPEMDLSVGEIAELQNEVYLAAIDACKAKALDLKLNGMKGKQLFVKAMDEYQPTSFRDEIDFIKKAICYFLTEVSGEFISNEDSDNAVQNKWNLDIETMDGVKFAIPFEDGKETFGSKLVTCSPIFKTMLKHPMKEKLHKMVKLGDIDCHTFINFLIYLKSGWLLAESFSEITDLYEMADKYDIKDLMRTCAERMVPFFSSDFINDIEVLAFFHNDDILLQLVESSKNKKLVLQSSSFSVENFEGLAKQYAESLNFEEMMEPAQENAF
ncbi:uncharacterized protein TNCT_369821 [Trichonephila clavata]|uniref:BTB domain-containing protein n=1 Tax=Trichonephila clavata TaxID=2740835 RepID=A0A8X6KXD1_TRICU|nr:uncharacterized protein TNCT_369821 [Trichonephila clavata]